MNHRPWIFWVPFLTTSSGISKDIWTSARNDKIYIRTTAHEYLRYSWKIDKKTNSFSMWFYLRKLLISFSHIQSKGAGKSQHNCQSVKTLRFSATKLLSPKVCLNTCENGNGLQTKHNNLFWTVTFLKLCQKKSFPTRLLISRPMMVWRISSIMPTWPSVWKLVAWLRSHIYDPRIFIHAQVVLL